MTRVLVSFLQMIRFLTLLLCTGFLLFGLPQQCFSGWTKVKQFNTGVGCGYFFDAENGLIGLGEFNTKLFGGYIPTGPLQIYWTSDGGNSWTESVMPKGGTGRVTSISMADRLTGYAAIFSNQYSLWKTTDGGKSWQDITNRHFDLVTSVYATSRAITKTVWGGNYGGRSIDGGNTFNTAFLYGDGECNGIDFADDLNGIATIGPRGGACWMTSDGGVNWQQGDNLPESWSVYAVRGTKTFLALSEDNAMFPGQTVYWTQNGGQNWSTRYTFQGGPSFTGHIAGMGNTIYVQTDTVTNDGMYRSDDQGASWVNVGGPSNVRDTRFVVTGCRGEVVYAFDDQGWVWKTTDGGNGAFGFTPRIGSIPSARAGDSVLIPIYIDSTTSAFSISSVSGSLSLNTDLLTPFGVDTTGTLSKTMTFDSLYTGNDGSINFQVNYKTALKNGIAFSTPVIYIKAYVYVTEQDSTDVILNSLSINSGAAQKTLSVCSISSNFFTRLSECGDSSLQQFMKTGSAPQLLSINPNPASSANVALRIYLPEASDITLDVLDGNGKFVKSGIVYGKYTNGIHTLNLSTTGLPNGVHTILLHLGSGSNLSGRVVIVK